MPTEPAAVVATDDLSTSRDRLTDRQREIFDWVVQYIASNGYPPTLRDIGKQFGIRSTNGISDHLRALERKGFIRRSYLKSRGIVVTGKTEGEARPTAALAIDSWRAENMALRELLRRVYTAARRLPGLSAEMVVVLGDLREVLAAKEPGQ